MRGADVPLRIGPVVIEIGRWVYGTVTLMTVLVVYADDGLITFRKTASVVIATLLATFLAHLFAHVLAVLNSESGGLGSGELRTLLRGDAQYLLLTVPPLGVLLVGALGVFSVSTAISLIMWGGLALLVVLGALAGGRVGLGLWGIVASAVGSGVLGLLVLAVQVLLKL